GPDEEASGTGSDSTGFTWAEPAWRSQPTAGTGAEEGAEGSIFAKLLRDRQPEQPRETSAADEEQEFFSLDDVEQRVVDDEAPTSGSQDRAHEEITPFSLSDLGLGDEETSGTTRQPPASQPADHVDEPADEVTPFSLRDL